jgi:hypothetical protein
LCFIFSASGGIAQILDNPPSVRYADFHEQIRNLAELVDSKEIITDPLYISALTYFRDKHQAEINSAIDLRSLLTEICDSIDLRNSEINNLVADRSDRTPTEEEISEIISLKTDKAFCAFKGTVIPSYQGKSFVRNSTYLRELSAIESRAILKRDYYNKRISACEATISCKRGTEPHRG